MERSISYQKEVRTAFLHGRPVTLTLLTPRLSEKERESRRKLIERSLFEVFSKYPCRRS